MPRLTPESIASIRKMRSAGHSISEICSAIGAGRATVHRYCDGIRLPFGPLKRGRKPTFSRVVCRRLRDRGLTLQAIADRLGISKTAVYCALSGRAA